MFPNSRCVFYKSRRETTAFDQFCFREGLKTSTKVRTAGRWLPILFYIPNADEFFEGRLLSLLQQCRDCLHENSDGGHAEFLARRLEEYQRTLRVIYGRVRESDQENQLTQDLERLMQAVGTRLQSLQHSIYSDIYCQGSTEQSNTLKNSLLFALERSGNAGRPRYEIRQEQIHGLRESLEFRRVDIARMLGMSIHHENNGPSPQETVP